MWEKLLEHTFNAVIEITPVKNLHDTCTYHRSYEVI